jgi:hypothetical protein
MAKSIKTTIQTEDKHSISWSAFIVWPFVILSLYVLSTGPLVMMFDKKIVSPNSNLWRVYQPLEWAYDETLLHRPLGMYLHLWSKRFDKNGDPKA